DVARIGRAVIPVPVAVERFDVVGILLVHIARGSAARLVEAFQAIGAPDVETVARERAAGDLGFLVAADDRVLPRPERGGSGGRADLGRARAADYDRAAPRGRIDAHPRAGGDIDGRLLGGDARALR